MLSTIPTLFDAPSRRFRALHVPAIAFLLTVNTQAADVTYTFDATLLEDYGTISTGDLLSGTIVVDDGTGSVVSIVVGHSTAGDFSTSTGPINVFNNAFGGGVDAIAFQGLDTMGNLGGVPASSRDRKSVV